MHMIIFSWFVTWLIESLSVGQHICKWIISFVFNILPIETHAAKKVDYGTPPEKVKDSRNSAQSKLYNLKGEMSSFSLRFVPYRSNYSAPLKERRAGIRTVRWPSSAGIPSKARSSDGGGKPARACVWAVEAEPSQSRTPEGLTPRGRSIRRRKKVRTREGGWTV